MSFPGSPEASARFAYNALKSGGWTTAAISDVTAQKKLAELMAKSHRQTSIQMAPALLSLAALAKELHVAAMKRELTTQEISELERLMTSLMSNFTSPVPSTPPGPPKVEPDPGVPSFDPMRPAPKVEKVPEPAKKGGLFTR